MPRGPARLFPLPFEQTYAWSPAVLINEFNAGSFQGAANRQSLAVCHECPDQRVQHVGSCAGLRLIARARSSAVHLMSARAALIWALVKDFFCVDIHSAIWHLSASPCVFQQKPFRMEVEA